MRIINKYQITRAFICVFTILLLFVGIKVTGFSFVQTASASNNYDLHLYSEEPSASSKILIYHQSGNQQVEWQRKKLAKSNGVQIYMGSNSPTKKVGDVLFTH